MDINKFFEYQKPLPGLIGVEKIMLCYWGLTFGLILVVGSEIPSVMSMMIYRLLILGGTALLWRFYVKFPCHFTYVLRVVFQMLLMGFWYPDIYHFACLMPNLDPLFALADQYVFGCQPAILFSRVLSGNFWSELFYMGYFSYYLMFFSVILWSMFVCFRRFDKTTNIILATFMMYFVVFIFLESAGPQFYFTKIGEASALKGIFPQVGDWFRFHPELIHTRPCSGLFCRLVEMMQGGEAPIAAFPSSHVGMATIMLILAYKMSVKFGRVVLPFYIILCFSTVYIGAHYAVDVIGGWISGLLFYYIAQKIYYTKFIHRPKDFDSMHRYGHSHHHHHEHHHHHLSQEGE